MLPNPTAEPTAAAMAPIRVANPARFAIASHYLSFGTKVAQSAQKVKPNRFFLLKKGVFRIEEPGPAAVEAVVRAYPSWQHGALNSAACLKA